MKSCGPDVSIRAVPGFVCFFFPRSGMVLLNSELFSVNIGFSVSRRFDAFSKNSPTFGETKRKKKKRNPDFGGRVVSVLLHLKAAIASFRCFYTHWKPTVAENRTLIFVIAEIKIYIFVQIFASCGGCVTDCTFVGEVPHPRQALCGQCWYLLDGPGIQCVSLGAFQPGWQFGLFCNLY